MRMAMLKSSKCGQLLMSGLQQHEGEEDEKPPLGSDSHKGSGVPT